MKGESGRWLCFIFLYRSGSMWGASEVDAPTVLFPVAIAGRFGTIPPADLPRAVIMLHICRPFLAGIRNHFAGLNGLLFAGVFAGV
jgi:hypothetical protein